MKKVFLIRHAKSSWDNPELEDKDRPLKKRGEKDSEIMGELLKKFKIKPDVILSSPARRALSTARIISDYVDYDKKKIIVNDDLYFEGIKGMMNIIHQFDNKLQTALLFGHNPDMTEMLNRFSKKAIENVPTCGVGGVEFEIKEWKDADWKNGKLAIYEYPSKYR